MPKNNSKHKILVTGGAGFIGSHVAQAYCDEGFSVVVVDNLSTGRKENIPPQALFYKADISDAKALEEIFKKEKPQVVNHHAAQIDVRESVAHPEYDSQINILAGISLLELSRKYGCKKWIYASTGGALYGEVPNLPAKESTPIEPISPYGTSKYCLEKYITLYGRLYGLQYTILRYANVYGPRQIPKAEGGVVAVFINAMMQNNPVTIFGDGDQQRDFVYVEDVANANLLSLHGADQKIINIGTGGTTSVRTLFNLLKKELQYPGAPKFAPKRPGEIVRSVLDPGLAKKLLHWEPSNALNTGLQKTIDWAQKGLDKKRSCDI